MKRTLLVVLAVIVLAGLYLWGAYNRFITLNETVTTQWAQVETQYQRRLDLIPNLVASVKGVLKQEQKIFGDLAEARSRYLNASSIDEKAGAATQIESLIPQFLLVVENYPQLKSSENVQTLMAQLEGTENRVSVERQRFNDSVRSFNVLVKRFPSSVIAGLFSFQEKTYFEAAEGAENAPKVEL